MHAAPREGYMGGGKVGEYLLSPVFGARYRVERVLRKVAGLAASSNTSSSSGFVRSGRRDRLHGESGGGGGRGAKVSRLPRVALPREMSLPLPAVGGPLFSPRGRAVVMGEGEGDGGVGSGVGLAV